MAKRPAKQVAKRKARGGLEHRLPQGATVVLLSPGAQITFSEGDLRVAAPPLGVPPDRDA